MTPETRAAVQRDLDDCIDRLSPDGVDLATLRAACRIRDLLTDTPQPLTELARLARVSVERAADATGYLAIRKLATRSTNADGEPCWAVRR